MAFPIQNWRAKGSTPVIKLKWKQDKPMYFFSEFDFFKVYDDEGEIIVDI